MFTTDDIRNIAIQIERNGEKTYRSASLKTRDKQLARLLTWMADEERQHLHWFESLEMVSGVPAGNREMEAMGQALLRDMMKNQTFSLREGQLLTADEITSLLAQSLAFEQDTVLFYEMLRSFIADAHSLARLDAVIAEEKRHIGYLEKKMADCENKKV